MSDSSPCDACGESVQDALSRTVRLSVDRSQIDAQRLCPDCFAGWIDRYDSEMRQTPTSEEGDDGTGIIVD
jgi:hypothetical protein